ncbi:MAG: hypothetical protein JWN44_2540 [Myxococcales bacterium]|nr:hypothetical protein [Myxococcales bacterium]
MRRLAAALLLLATARVEAAEVRMLAGTDFLLTTDPSFNDVSDAEIGLSARIDARNVGGRWDFRLDFSGREGLLGNSTYNNLYELSATARRLAGGRLDVTLGRFRTPGGFWLIADGAMLTARYTPWLSQSVYGGLRAFTTGRRDAWMTDSSPTALPLAGTALFAAHRLVSGSLTFTWARDGIDLHEERIPSSGKNRLERHIEDEWFLDGQVALYPHDKVYLSAGASFGTRYDIRFDATNPYGATTLGISTLGAFDVYALVEYRPLKRLRLQYTFNFERVRVFQSHLLSLTPAGTPVEAADGSFQDHQARAVWLVWRSLRVETSYRLRARANTDVEHHLALGARSDELWRRGLGAFASVAVDVNRGIDAPLDDAMSRRIHNRVVYSAGLAFVRPWLDARAGLTFTDGIGSGLLFSQQRMSDSGTAPTVLFPYVLDVNRIVFVRAFATFWKMFAGLDVEENLDAAQLRLLVQVGAAL